MVQKLLQSSVLHLSSPGVILLVGRLLEEEGKKTSSQGLPLKHIQLNIRFLLYLKYMPDTQLDFFSPLGKGSMGVEGEQGVVGLTVASQPLLCSSNTQRRWLLP